ncbi:MAG: CoA transferase [Dehalococcoidia bacterium]|nr:CoA transferase [Dehalococcoidia bacterium]
MTQTLPLQGVKVLDLTQIMAGPYCTMMLADMGADVVKVEKPNGGDDTRRMGPPFIEGESAAFLGINRNKRSIVIDLRSDSGRELAQRMARESDVLVQNFRPGSLDRMGLGYEQVREINPAIVYCTISGFGATGPYAQRGGFDLVTQGMSGLMSVTGHADGPPAKVGVPICDLNAGMFGAIGILAAYINRLRTGQGQHVDTSLLEGGIAYTFWESAMYFATGEVPEPKGSAHRLTAPYQAFETSDGYVNIGAANQANWERLCVAIGCDELVTDPRFVEPRDRMVNIDELVSTLDAIFSQQSSDHWLEKLANAGVPAGPIYDLDEVYSDPQVQAREMMVETDHPVAGRVKNIGIPIKLSETPGQFQRPAPALGQHTNEVLTDLGCSPDDIEKLRGEGIVA